MNFFGVVIDKKMDTSFSKYKNELPINKYSFNINQT